MTNTTAPEDRTFETNLVQVTARLVKVGDTLNDRKGVPANVATVKVGDKWTELRTEDGTLIRRCHNDDTVTVSRTVETDESRERRQKAQRNERVADNMQKARDLGPRGNVERVYEKLGKEIADGHDVSRLAEDLMEAEAKDFINRRMLAVYDHRIAEGEEPSTALAQVVEHFKEMMVESYDLTRGSSRSTNMVSNLCDDIRREQIADFIRHQSWWAL